MICLRMKNRECRARREEILSQRPVFWFQGPLLKLDVTTDLLNIPNHILVSTYRLVASKCKIKCFEYENRESRESSNHTKRLNWSSFKDASLQKSNMCQPLEKINQNHMMVY